MKKKLTLLQQEYLKVADLFLWGRRIDFTAWFRGDFLPRDKQAERILPVLEEKGFIHSQWYKGSKAYTTSKKRSDSHIPHGLTCTRILLRLKHSRDGIFIPENYFRKAKFKVIPDLTVQYENGTILGEGSMADNFRRTRLMKSKVRRYINNLHKFEEVLNAKCIVLFVLNAPRHDVEYFAYQNGGEDIFYIDHETFFSAPRDKQLTSDIYIWGGDGKSYPLSSE